NADCDRGLTGNHHHRAGALGFRELTRGSHPYVETAFLAANDWTIGIRRIERIEKTAATCASAPTGGQVCAMFTAGRDRTRGFELSRSRDVAAEIEQQVERRAAAWPVDARLNGRSRRDPHRSDAAAAAGPRQPGH